jgi:HEAT repeat protein
VARTPLLMALFAEGYRENAADAAHLRDLSTSPGELRDRIFERYMRQRYERETRRVEQIGRALPYTLDEIYSILGELAMSNARNAGRPGPLIPVKENVLEHHHLESVLDAADIPPFTDLVTRLHLLDHGEIDTQGSPTFRFVHLLLRDFLGFEYTLTRVDDPDSFMRSVVADALGQLGFARAVPLLITALRQDDHFLVRRDAAYALGELGDPRSLDALYTALVEDDEEHIRSTAAQAIGKIGGPQAFDLLIAALPNRSEQARRSIAHALIATGDAHALERVIALLHDPNDQVRLNAASALGTTQDTRAVPPLLAALGDHAENVRYSAAIALGRLGDVRAVTPLCQTLFRDTEQVRHYAAEALVRFSDSAIEPLIRTLVDETRLKDPHAHDSVTDILERIGTPDALAALDALRRGEIKPGTKRPGWRFWRR